MSNHIQALLIRRASFRHPLVVALRKAVRDLNAVQFQLGRCAALTARTKQLADDELDTIRERADKLARDLEAIVSRE